MSKSIHIISFDIPFPANYGGAQDVFYKIKGLKALGYYIKLHIFTFEDRRPSELNVYADEVYYYKRSKWNSLFSFKYPYRTFSRKHKDLLVNLKKDNFPILFEGLQSAYLLSHPDLMQRVKLLRSHNLEHEYMDALAKEESHPLLKYYYRFEAKRFLKQEAEIKQAQHILSISLADQEYFQSKGLNSVYVPVFHPNDEVVAKPGKGNYILFHGNLSVAENYNAVNYYLDHIHFNVDMNCVIAGKDPTAKLVRKIDKTHKVELIENCTDKQMSKLIQEAQILFLYTRQSTGIKLKLINSLYQGRFCLCNKTMVKGTGLKELCVVAKDKRDFIHQINELKNKEFTQEEIDKRKSILENGFSNIENAKLIDQLLLG